MSGPYSRSPIRDAKDKGKGIGKQMVGRAPGGPLRAPVWAAEEALSHGPSGTHSPRDGPTQGEDGKIIDPDYRFEENGMLPSSLRRRCADALEDLYRDVDDRLDSDEELIPAAKHRRSTPQAHHLGTPCSSPRDRSSQGSGARTPIKFPQQQSQTDRAARVKAHVPDTDDEGERQGKKGTARTGQDSRQSKQQSGRKNLQKTTADDASMEKIAKLLLTIVIAYGRDLRDVSSALYWTWLIPSTQSLPKRMLKAAKDFFSADDKAALVAPHLQVFIAFMRGMIRAAEKYQDAEASKALLFYYEEWVMGLKPAELQMLAKHCRARTCYNTDLVKITLVLAPAADAQVEGHVCTLTQAIHRIMVKLDATLKAGPPPKGALEQQAAALLKRLS